MVSDEFCRNEKADFFAGNAAEARRADESALPGDGSLGNELSQRNEEPGQAEENHLIDFLYRDSARIDSLVSQLFQGALTSFAVSQNSTNQDGNKLSLGMPMLRGDNSISRSQTDGVQKNYAPHDVNLIDLLANLKPILDCRPLSLSDIGRLCIVSGKLIIRDYRSLKQTAPILFESKEVQDGIAPNNKRLGRDIAKMLGSILKVVPMGIELELHTTADEVLIGPAKAECFTDNIEDVSRTYGNSMPGMWSVLAVVDATDATEINQSSSAIRKSMDDLANLTRAMYTGMTAQHVMSPILIFRNLRIK